MVGSRFGTRSALAPYGLALGALVIGACQVEATEEPPFAAAGASGAGASGTTTGGTGGMAGAGGTTLFGSGGGLDIGLGGTTPSGVGGTTPIGSGGTTPIGSGGMAPLPPEPGFEALYVTAAPPVGTCDSAERALFCDQIVWNSRPAARVLYSWTTPEQVAELRRDRVLLTRTERPDLGRGYAFEAIDELAARGTAPQNQLLAKLSQELFLKARYAWPNAWGARMGWPGEDYGDELLRIVLKPEAWIVIVADGQGMAVVDLDNRVVSAEAALASPERIAAIFFYRREIISNGSFTSCGGGYREFIVGNEAMVEEWSLATPDIRTQIEHDAELFETFLLRLRSSTTSVDAATFPVDVVCQWDSGAVGEIQTYQRAVALANELYVPLPERVATIAKTLREGLFEPDPFVVKPGD
jgi:hypothetical protein